MTIKTIKAIKDIIKLNEKIPKEKIMVEN